MSLRLFLLGLAVQAVAWPALYWLSVLHFNWVVRRRRRRGDRSNTGHYSELVLVLGVIALMIWVLLFLLKWVRP